MSLIQLKHYVQSRSGVSLLELSQNFNADPELIRDMLRLLMHKGRVRQKQKTNLCGAKCVKCPPMMTEIYEWVE